AAINGTSIQARAAANAKQALAQWAAQNSRAAIVENDEVKLPRSVELTGLPRPGDELRIDRQLLTCRSAGEDLQEVRQIGEARNDFLDSHDRNVALRQRTGEPAVAFVRDEHNRAGFGDCKICPRNTDFRLRKLLPQRL